MANTSTFRALVKWGLVISIIFSIALVIIYSTGLYVPDETLFYLLLAMRFSSFFVCIFSVYLFFSCIGRFIRQRSPGALAATAVYLLAVFFGAGLVVFNIFIAAIAGGNV